MLRGIGLGAAGLAVSGCGPTRKAQGKAIVIGSGFGGAVAALRLGEAGFSTVVLERGKRWDVDEGHDTFCTNLSPDERSTWLSQKTVMPLGPTYPIKPYVGVLERVSLPNMHVYRGAGVGGGSLVYGGMTVAPEREFHEEIFPAGVPAEELETRYYPMVKAMLGTRVVPEDLYNEPMYTFARVGAAQAQKAGLSKRFIEQACDWDVVRAELRGDVPKAASTGELIYGANSGYKNSLDRNYLPRAEATGMIEIRPLHRVDGIRKEGDKYVVMVTRIDEEGEPIGNETLVCDYLFLGAGSLGTTELLLKSREQGGLPNLNDAVGAGWGSNGNAMFFRSDLGVATGHPQANPPVIAIEDLDNPILPLLVEQAPFPIGFEHNSLLHLAVAFDPQRGRLSWNGVDGRLTLDWPDGGSPHVPTAVTDFNARLNEVNGGKTGLVNKLVDMPGITNDFTYHPLGGVNLGEATDLFGRVKGYDNLFVVDGALVPGSAGCANPALLIAALAERCMEHILETDLA